MNNELLTSYRYNNSSELNAYIRNIIENVSKANEIIEQTQNKMPNITREEKLLFFEAMYYLTNINYMINYGEKHTDGFILDESSVLSSALVDGKELLVKPNTKDSILKKVNELFELWEEFNNGQNNAFDMILNVANKEDLNPLLVSMLFALIETTDEE